MTPHPVPRRLAAAAVGCLLIAIGFVAAPPVAAAQPAAPVTDGWTADADPLPANVRHVCGAPKPGYAQCLALERTDVPDRLGPLAAGVHPDGYGPDDLQDAYNLPSDSAGSGQTVAIVDAYDAPRAEADLAVYRAEYGLPPCTTANGCFRKVNDQGKRGSYPVPDADWAVEVALDLDMVSAICPRCHIALVEATTNSMQDLSDAAWAAASPLPLPGGPSLGAKYVSNSYGGPESPFIDYDEADWGYSAAGVTFTASAGDDGYGVIYPAASRWTVAVGGTSLLPAANARGWDEITWMGSGSGCSAQITNKPPWQHNDGCSHRTVSDVSAVADPETGVAIYDSYQRGGWFTVGGTSASAPIIASVYALAGPPPDGRYQPPSYPYAHPEFLNDIVAGTNSFYYCDPESMCNAGPGYDAPTGLGTPNGIEAFVPTLAAS